MAHHSSPICRSESIGCPGAAASGAAASPASPASRAMASAKSCRTAQALGWRGVAPGECGVTGSATHLLGSHDGWLRAAWPAQVSSASGLGWAYSRSWHWALGEPPSRVAIEIVACPSSLVSALFSERLYREGRRKIFSGWQIALLRHIGGSPCE